MISASRRSLIGRSCAAVVTLVTVAGLTFSLPRVGAAFSATTTNGPSAVESLAFFDAGSAFAAGDPTQGQTGTVDLTAYQSPVLVPSPNPWSVISSGDVHSCAVRTDGTLWCWGGNP